MSNKDWNTLQNYARYAYDEHTSEIGGFLIAEQDKDNKWKMHKPVILQQEISAGNTVLDKDALAEYYVKTAMKMKDKPFQFVWWHSHHTMEVFWSGTDLTAIDEFSNGQMSISLVINLKQEYKLRVNLWHPYEMHQDVEMDIINKPKTKVVPKPIRDNVDKLCNEPPKLVYPRTTRVSKHTHNQLSVWQDQKPYDLEMIQVEAKIDNILMDYLTNLDYLGYQLSVNKLNCELKHTKSELRCGLVDSEEHEKFLFAAMATFHSDDWIYSKGTKWSFADKCIEYDIGDEEEPAEYGGYSNVGTAL
jgi:hypothetical protein